LILKKKNQNLKTEQVSVIKILKLNR